MDKTSRRPVLKIIGLAGAAGLFDVAEGAETSQFGYGYDGYGEGGYGNDNDHLGQE